MRISIIFSEAFFLSIPTIFSLSLSLCTYFFGDVIYRIEFIIIDSYLKGKRGENSFQQERAGLEVIKRVINIF